MRIVFCGNCQMAALNQCYAALVVPHTGDVTQFVRYLQVDLPRSRQAASQADVVVEQIWPMQDVPGLRDVDAAARRIRVPSAGTPFLWPFIGVLHAEGRQKYGDYNPFTGEYSDTWLLRRMKMGQDPATIEADYMALDIARHAHLDRRLEISLDIQRRLDRPTGYDFASIIDTHFRRERLFKTAYHAEGRIMRHLLTHLLDELNAPAAACHAARHYLQAGLFHPREMPIHPGIAAHFGLAWAGEDTLYRFTSETLITFREWVGRFLRCESYPIVWQAVDAVRLAKPGAEALLAQAESVLPDSPLVMYSRAIVTLRARQHAAALPALDSLAKRHPDLPFIDGHLADCHQALGDHAAAEAALRREVARSAHVRSLHLRLAGVLRAQGKAQEAEPHLQAAKELVPRVAPPPA